MTCAFSLLVGQPARMSVDQLKGAGLKNGTLHNAMFSVSYVATYV